MIYIMVGLIGWLTGVLVNYLSDVLPIKRRLVYPVCILCKEKFPISKYIGWDRTCSNCGTKRSKRCWFIEIVFIIIVELIWLYPPAILGFYIGLILLAYLAVVAIIDIENHVIMHEVSIFGAILCLVIGIWKHGILSTIMGGLTGFVVMFLLYYLGIVLVKYRSKKHIELNENEALGFGDVNLGGVIGLLLGWPAVWLGIILTILTSGAVSFFYILYMLLKRRYRANLTIPYGPFIVMGAVILIYLHW